MLQTTATIVREDQRK